MPLVTMQLTGRLGNLLFQYAHLRAWAEQNGYEVCLPPWVGERVFDIPQAVRHSKPDRDLGEQLFQRQENLIYTRAQVRKWFTFKPEVLEKLQEATCNEEYMLNVRGNPDYISAGMVCISPISYREACTREFGQLDQLDWTWETDKNPTQLDTFTGDPSASGLHTSEVCLPSFYRLMTAPILFRAVSTFAWWAATLGNGRVFSPVIDGIKGGIPDQYCDNFVEGNWPKMSHEHTDLHLKEN